jgi:hypothetical protein
MVLGVFAIRNRRRVESVTINVDNQAAILASVDNKPGPGKYMLDILHEQISTLKDRNDDIKLKVRWTPGHVGIKGNEEADVAAKAASAGACSARKALPKQFRKPLPTSKSAAKQCFNAKLQEAAREAWRISPQANRLKGIVSDVGGKKYRKATAKVDRCTGSLWTQLKTGHIGLNAHLHRIKISETAACTACKQYNETVDHVLRHCRAYDEPRLQLRRHVRRDMTDLRKLLGNDNNITYVAAFVRKTKRLAWTLKQDKKQITQSSLFSGYSTHRENRTAATGQRAHNCRGRATRCGGQGQGMQGERVVYAAGDIRNWLTTGNRGERERERGGAENGMRRRCGQGQGRGDRESGQVGDGAAG